MYLSSYLKMQWEAYIISCRSGILAREAEQPGKPEMRQAILLVAIYTFQRVEGKLKILKQLYNFGINARLCMAPSQVMIYVLYQSHQTEQSFV